MKILIVGNGGREHALLWKLYGDEPDSRFFITIGNGGTGTLAQSIRIQPTDTDGIVEFSSRERIDLVVVGPELPLDLGLADRLKSEGIPVFGPGRDAAQIETSKSFSKKLMRKYGIPTAPFEVFSVHEEAVSFVKSQSIPLVVKASGLAAGKGSIVCNDQTEALRALDMIMVKKAFGDAGNEVVVEERLEGEELSFFVLTDGERVLPLSPSQDHKRAYDGDRGLNTGGMGAYAPVSIATPSLTDRILREIVTPTVNAMREEGIPYIGVLYTGLILTADGPSVIEFNARFGDPEAQVNLPLIDSNLVQVMLDISSGELKQESLRFRDDCAVCVVMASGGYPGKYEKGKVIRIPYGLESDNLVVFHAGTTLKDNILLTSGGRVLGVTALGENIVDARDRCYEGVERIHFDGAHFRTDIAHREMARAGA